MDALGLQSPFGIVPDTFGFGLRSMTEISSIGICCGDVRILTYKAVQCVGMAPSEVQPSRLEVFLVDKINQASLICLHEQLSYICGLLAASVVPLNHLALCVLTRSAKAEGQLKVRRHPCCVVHLCNALPLQIQPSEICTRALCAS